MKRKIIMPVIKELSLPEEIKGKKINLVRRTHKYDKQMCTLLNKNRRYLKKYLRWLDQNKTFNDTVRTTSSMMEKWDQKLQFNYLIVDKKDELLGAIGVANINMLDRHAEFGYWLREDKTGCGFMSEALQLLEKILFSQKIRRLEIECVVSNRPSINVAIRNGYVSEGYKKEYFYLNGIFEDAVVYVKMNPKRK